MEGSENKKREIIFFGICRRYGAVGRGGRGDEIDDKRTGEIFKRKEVRAKWRNLR